jgi:hypothetical protein
MTDAEARYLEGITALRESYKALADRPIDRTLGSGYRADTSDPPQHTLYWRSGSLVVPGDGPRPGMDPGLFR